MIKSIFDIALEEDNVNIDPDNINSTDVPDNEDSDQVIVSEDDVAELEEIKQEAQEQSVHLEQSEECLEVVQDEVSKQEEIIEQKPEEITEENVRVAQECLAYSIGKLGLGYKDFKVQRLSLEAHKDLPIEKLKITMEGLKDIISLIVEKIKKILASIGQFFRRMWQKIIMMVGGYEKKAKELIDRLNKNGLKSEISKKDLSRYLKLSDNVLLESLCKTDISIIYDAPQNIIARLAVSDDVETLIKDSIDLFEEEEVKKYTNILKQRINNTDQTVKMDIEKKINNNIIICYYYVCRDKSKFLAYNKERQTFITDVFDCSFIRQARFDKISSKSNTDSIKLTDIENAAANVNLWRNLLNTTIKNISKLPKANSVLGKAQSDIKGHLDRIQKQSSPSVKDKTILSLLHRLAGNVILDMSAGIINRIQDNIALVKIVIK